MACVYRATDTSTGRELALKRLFRVRGKGASETSALFEREFHTLVQFSHPRVVAVYDFGIDEHGSFYTMELLDGGDLKERSPCAWRDACALLYDICSSLALVHSRRLVHGDVSPRNVRCTREGHAKLIDFGALTPMGRCEKIVGTPAFVAPEVVGRMTLDARTDLYSFGATLYYALTGQLPYPVYDFSGLEKAWQEPPPPPSRYAPDIPPALDALVLSLLEVDPNARPHTTFEVMQRLAAVAGFAEPEHAGVAQAYLSTPNLVGREQALAVVRQRCDRARVGRGGGLLVTGAAGVGRSRMLDASVTSAKTLGALVLRAGATGGGAFSTAQLLLDRLLEALPKSAEMLAEKLPALAAACAPEAAERRTLASLDVPRAELQRALSDVLLRVTDRHTLVIAVDDLQRVDDASSALLAGLVHGAGGRSLLLIATRESGVQEQESAALALLGNACAYLPLLPLTAAETQELLASVFGDVPNLQLLSKRVFARAQGNPRVSMDLVQHLVDVQLVRYDRGGWTIPNELEEAQLPFGEAALQQRLAQLSPAARRLAGAHALAAQAGMGEDDHQLLLEGTDAVRMDAVISELLAQQVLQREGGRFSLSHAAVGRVLLEGMRAEELRACHVDLVRWLEQRKAFPPLIAKHCMAGGQEERGLKLLCAYYAEFDDPQLLLNNPEISVADLQRTTDVALQLALRTGASARDVAELRYWLVVGSAIADIAYYKSTAPAMLAQLEHDSGLIYYDEPGQTDTPLERLGRAFARASERFAATAEHERAYKPEDAIKCLVRFVAVSIAVGTKSYDGAILSSLPRLLEPFAPLSPLVHAIWQNSVACAEVSCSCRVLSARERWKGVLERLVPGSTPDEKYVVYIRGAVAFGLGLVEARIGLASASQYVDMLDADPLQAVNAMYLRKIIRLSYGDLTGADEYRKQAEWLAVEAQIKPLFSSTLVLELIAHAMARDVRGLKQIRDRIQPLAESHRGWQAFGHLAEGLFQRLIGNLSAAKSAIALSMELACPDPAEPQRVVVAWPTAVAAYVETLVDLDAVQDAIACGEAALAQSGALQFEVSAHPIVRSVALAEARAGAFERAIPRLERLIEEQLALGVKGIHLGASYEARVRIAAWAQDREAVQRFAQLTAEEYRQGANSALSARYAALMVETPEVEVVEPGSTADFMSTIHVRSAPGQRRSASSLVERALTGAQTGTERAERALKILCEAHGARAGQLFLCSESGLALVATQGAPGDVPEHAAERVAEFFAREVDEDGMITGSPEDDAPTLDASDFRALLVQGSIDDVTKIAGVAALFSSAPDTDMSKSTQLSDALGNYLLRSGDATGVSRS